MADPKFSPAWWLRGPHPQTLWSQFFRGGPRPSLREERLATADDDTISLFHHGPDRGQPRLLLLHGLEGSQRSHYVGGLVSRAECRGWSATVLVFRGCGPELNTAPRLYHSGETTDLDFVVRELIRRDPGVPLLLAGVSLGGNVLCKWLGEQGHQGPTEVRAAAAVSVPFDLEAGSRYLQRGFSRVYDRHFLASLRAKAYRKLEQYPRLFDSGELARAATIEDFDDTVTAPIHGFAGSHDYYARSSAIGFLPRIRVPTLLLSAADDPFLPREVLDRVRGIASANPALRVLFTEHGGHVGFIAGRSPFRPTYWAEERLMEFLDSQTVVPLAGRDVSV